MIARILSAVDGSPTSLVALHHGAEIARRTGAQLQALFVKDRKILESGALGDPTVHDKIEAAIETEARHALGRARDLVGRLGMRLETDIRVGVVPQVLCEAAQDADLVTMGRWGENEVWATGLLGGAVECVVRKVDKPVLVASGAYREPRRVLVAYDQSEYARRALRLGAYLACVFNVPLALLNVCWHAEEGAELLREAEREANDIVAASPCDPEEKLQIIKLVHDGERAAEIAAEADEDTLTFMGAYGKSPMRHLILGSVTAQVMRAAKGAVVLCR